MSNKYNLTIELKNKYKLLSAFNNAPEDLAEAIQSAIMKVGGYTLGEVKKITPVDTGMLRLNTHLEQVMPLRIVITPNYDITPYAEHVLNRNDYLQQTAETKGKQIQEFFNKALDNFVKKLISDMR